MGVLVSRLLEAQGLDGEGTLHTELVGNFVKLYEEAFDLTVLYPGVMAALDAFAETLPQVIADLG